VSRRREFQLKENPHAELVQLNEITVYHQNIENSLI
jgi:hypothetical protein